MLSVTNQNVIDFYNLHPQLNFENMNIALVGILNGLILELSPSMDNNFALSILNAIKNVELSNAIKCNEMKKEYVTDLQSVINNNNNTLLLEMASKNKTVFDDKINELKNINNATVEKQNDIDDKINQVLKKFDSSSKKGNMSEMATYNLLKSMYSESQLKIVNTTKETADIVLTRKDKHVIIIENKDYTQPVVQKEVDKFIRDINSQKCSGIFISQNSDIANKKPFEINFYGTYIGVYISNVKYDSDIIQIAIDTIDAIKSKMVILSDSSLESDEESDEDEKFTISEEQLFIINNEYNILTAQKLKHIKTIKDFSKKLITETECINLPTLQIILAENYGTNKNTEWKCTLCDYIGKNKGSLSSHKKAHRDESNN